jgi:glycosyltransferase involved in cell wall biosynthesis
MAYGRIFRAPVVLDSHPASFGRKGSAAGKRLLPVHRWMVSRVASSVVTTSDWVQVVRDWGGDADLLHEAPGDWDTRPLPPVDSRPIVLVVGIFSGDEPVSEVLEAAAAAPELDVRLTGETSRLAPGLVARAPDNVTFVGFLGREDYRAAVYGAHVILTLTTEPTSIMRAACEAVFAGRPVVVSDWPALRETFPHAVHVDNNAEGIARGILEAVDRLDELVHVATTAADEQRARWKAQLAMLERRLQLGTPEASASRTHEFDGVVDPAGSPDPAGTRGAGRR